MRYLIIGSGGREHAMAWKLSKETGCDKVYVTPGNGGTELQDGCENVMLSSHDEMIGFCRDEKIDLVIVGPEQPLVEGIVDRFEEDGIGIIGPHKEAAMLEGSKRFAKDFMMRNGIRTAAYKNFIDYNEALAFVKECEYPLVVKADGLAAGKGVVICNNVDDAEEALSAAMVQGRFGEGGKSVVIEEFITGVEASIIGLYDGESFKEFISCKDHKKIFEGETGPNTGGMGIISPNPYLDNSIMDDFRENILEKTLDGLKRENLGFKGFIFFGIMIREGKCYLLEYNLRMGDPETQAIMSLMDSKFSKVLNDCYRGNLRENNLKWKDGNCCSVVLASEGYPGKITTGREIIMDHEHMDDLKTFFAGAQIKEDRMVTSGGRVACVTAIGNTLEEAREMAYSGIRKISFNGMQFRRDI